VFINYHIKLLSSLKKQTERAETSARHYFDKSKYMFTDATNGITIILIVVVDIAIVHIDVVGVIGIGRMRRFVEGLLQEKSILCLR
jgi:hypothetical protein